MADATDLMLPELADEADRLANLLDELRRPEKARQTRLDRGRAGPVPGPDRR